MEETNEQEQKSILKALGVLIERQKRQSIKEEYQATVSDREVLGIMVSKYSEWGISSILDVFSSALEDSNFHGFSTWIDSLKSLTLKEIDAKIEALNKCHRIR